MSVVTQCPSQRFRLSVHRHVRYVEVTDGPVQSDSYYSYHLEVQTSTL